VPAGILTFVLGFVIGIPGFLRYAEYAADVNNAWMLRTIAHNPSIDPYAVTTGTTAISMLALFAFLFLTPLGLLTMYLIASGAVRALSAGIADDPRGDFILSAAHWGVTTLSAGIRGQGRRRTREQREGVEVPDVLATGEWAGLNVDYVVIASRRKPEWEAGAIILTSTDWYRLGAPLETVMPGGLRTLYPLTRLETTEVVRRGIQYELPRLTKRTAPKKQKAPHGQ
jgi:hypothetical protein